jgi:hypothetical protein
MCSNVKHSLAGLGLMRLLHQSSADLVLEASQIVGHDEGIL